LNKLQEPAQEYYWAKTLAILLLPLLSPCEFQVGRPFHSRRSKVGSGAVSCTKIKFPKESKTPHVVQINKLNNSSLVQWSKVRIVFMMSPVQSCLGAKFFYAAKYVIYILKYLASHYNQNLVYSTVPKC
jgi:hypothetical protein